MSTQGLCPSFQLKSTFPDLGADGGIHHASQRSRLTLSPEVFLSHKNEALVLFLITKTTATDVKDTSHTEKYKKVVKIPWTHTRQRCAL